MKILISLYVLCILFSCKKYKEHNEEEIASIRKKSIEMSSSILGRDIYMDIYSKMNDSVNVWIENQLGYYQYLGISKKYLIDSVLCVNKEGDKFITSILFQQLLEDGVQDDIGYFYGVKIKNNWYFFSGATMVLPREFYQEDIHKPLSFDKLKMIAADHIYRRYLKKNLFGKWEINDDFFSDLTSVAWCTDCKTQEDWDAAYLRQVNENWEKPKSEDEDKDKEWFLPMK